MPNILGAINATGTGLTQAIVRGDRVALNLAKQLLTNPGLMILPTNVSDGFATGAYMYIPLEVEKHQQNGNAEVSEQPIITPGEGGKQYYADNVAPGPWDWQLSGYIPGDSTIEMTNLFTPIVRFHVDILRQAFKNGARCIFKDMDQRIYKNVVIQNLSISTLSDCKNKAPFSMTLKEIVEIKANLAEYSETEQKSTPAGEVTDGGNTACVQKPHDGIAWSATIGRK